MGKSNKLSMGHYFKKELLLFFVSFYSVSLSQTYSIRTVDERITDHYVQVISMSQGSVEEITSGLNDTTTERSYRIIIVGRSVLKNEFQGNNVYFEEFISGPEGCCKRLVRSRKVDLFGLLSAFKISSEAFGMHFKNWNSARSFEFELCNKRFRVSHIDREKPTFSLIK